MNLLRWEWVVFLAPLGLASLLALSAAFGLGDHDGPDHDHDGHISPLEWLGVGVAPLSLVGLSFLLLFSVSGLIGNLAWGIGKVWLSLGLASLGALFGTRLVARGLARLAPSTESHAVERHELIGSEGVALYPITRSAGTVRLHDRLKNLRQLDCRTPEGDDDIPQGTKVTVVDYDPERQVFFVRRPERVFTQEG